MIKCKNLSIAFQNKNIINHIDLHIKKGKITSIIGPNGCGKSTLLRGISGLNRKYSGDIFIDDMNLKKIPLNQLSKVLAILPQGATAPSDLKVKDLVAYGRFPYKNFFGRNLGDNKAMDDSLIIKNAMEKTNIYHLKDRFVNTLSGGERQRAWISMALCQEPSLLILDEPTTYLDISHQLEVMEIVKELKEKTNITIVMVLHDMNHAIMYSDDIVILKDSKIYAMGEPNAVLNPKSLKEVFSVHAEYYYSKNNESKIILPNRLAKG